ncbi:MULTISPECIES: tail fiber assembly protein [unclassified Providencia]|uniref:tail fiber assembly protein n=1 Tax=unclassified Providencia TaxID=2633465 RepID=UPI00234ADCE8|nr:MULTISPECIES: tail fiber assembly protein [unclassified Providencia]
MLSYKNFTISENKDILEKYPDFVLVLEDEGGNDWYELQKNFKDDTLKILFDDENRIVSHSFDVSMLTPTNLSVAEVSQKKLPKDFFTNTNGYLFIDGKIEPLILSHEEEVKIAESKKQLLADEAEKNITILERKVRLGMTTDDVKHKLTEWEIYSVEVADVDTSLAPDIQWPLRP